MGGLLSSCRKKQEDEDNLKLPGISAEAWIERDRQAKRAANSRIRKPESGAQLSETQTQSSNPSLVGTGVTPSSTTVKSSSKLTGSGVAPEVSLRDQNDNDGKEGDRDRSTVPVENKNPIKKINNNKPKRSSPEESETGSSYDQDLPRETRPPWIKYVNSRNPYLKHDVIDDSGNKERLNFFDDKIIRIVNFENRFLPQPYDDEHCCPCPLDDNLDELLESEGGTPDIDMCRPNILMPSAKRPGIKCNSRRTFKITQNACTDTRNDGIYHPGVFGSTLNNNCGN